MKYFIVLSLLFQFLFSQELTRKIMVSSFNNIEDAQHALEVFNKNRSETFNNLEKEMNFKVIARPSSNLYVIVIEAFKDYKEAKIVLNEIINNHPDAFINKYTPILEEKTIDNKISQ